MSKTEFFTHTAPTGETITYQVRKLMGLIFLNMTVNFDPVPHIAFANDRITTIFGVRKFTSMEKHSSKSGAYYFLLERNYNLDILRARIWAEFDTYFLTLEKTPLP